MLTDSRRKEDEISSRLKMVADKLATEEAAAKKRQAEAEAARPRRSDREPKKRTIADGFITWEEYDRRQKREKEKNKKK